MKYVLILGAGKSSTVLIKYMLHNAEKFNWHVTVGDMHPEVAAEKIAGHARGEAVYFNADEDILRTAAIANADIVISLLPASMHMKVALDCVQYMKDFISASYVSTEMQALHEDAVESNIILLNEMGLDPGIDHMSAMQIINDLKDKGAVIKGFESYTGGLIAPESDTNPWNYKFTWNPRNVILAGQGVAKFIWKNRYKYIPYNKLFTRYDLMAIPQFGEFEGYPNRDSLKYREIYGLQNAETIVRGTLRKKGFCDAWNVFVQLGMTDDSYIVEDIETFTWKDLFNSLLPYDATRDVREKFIDYLNIGGNADIINKLDWLDIFSQEKVDLVNATPAQALQKLLEQKWKLMPGDKDMCVMLHSVDYEINGVMQNLRSYMVSVGEDELITAMAKTVGLPAGIAAKMILNDEIQKKGVVIPVDAEIYVPVLQELKDDFGIHFYEEVRLS